MKEKKVLSGHPKREGGLQNKEKHGGRLEAEWHL